MVSDLDDGELYRHMVDALGEHVPDDPGAARELIGVFVEQARQRLKTLGPEIDGGNASKVESQAHSLKSSCALLGLDEVAGVCAELEARARRGDLTGAGRLADEIAAAVARVARAAGP